MKRNRSMDLMISKLFGKSTSINNKHIIIVSGLPRSGTSMMMKMLEAGGIALLTDGQRAADEDNPKGYYELERVKKLKDGDTAWVREAQGKVVKVISFLLEYLPPDYQYKIVFMQRDIGEILASQRQMLIRRGESADKVSDQELAELFEKHLRKTESWLAESANIETLYVRYDQIVQAPYDRVKQIDDFLGGNLNINQMLAVIDPTLYRQKKVG